MIKTLSQDFNAVRDGRRAPWYSYEIDLSIPRTDTPGGGALELPIAGNSFYVDRAPDVGNASVQFQDLSFDRSMLPIYCGAGFIANVLFTQVKFTNVAQPGKVLRIFYGVDVDFSPGTASEIILSGAIKNLNENASILGDGFISSPFSFSDIVAVDSSLTSGKNGYVSKITYTATTAGTFSYRVNSITSPALGTVAGVNSNTYLNDPRLKNITGSVSIGRAAFIQDINFAANQYIEFNFPFPLLIPSFSSGLALVKGGTSLGNINLIGFFA